MGNKHQTRQRLREAAWAVFTGEGYSRASIQRITALAGYSRGAFYSNYSSKIELLLDLLRTDLDSTMQHLNSLARAHSECAGAAPPFLDSIRQDGKQMERSLLWIEAAVLATRNRFFREQFAQIQKNRIIAFSAYLLGPDRQPNPVRDLLVMVTFLGLYDDINLLQAAGFPNCAYETSVITLFAALAPDRDFRSDVRLL